VAVDGTSLLDWSADDNVAKPADATFLLSWLVCLVMLCFAVSFDPASRTRLDRFSPFSTLSPGLVLDVASAPIGCSLRLDDSCVLLEYLEEVGSV
jgi:hypothetical protein